VVKDLCGTATYTATEQCQSDVVVTDQCGTNWYHSSTHFCQSLNVVKDLCGGQTFAATEFCQGTTIKDLCGTATYTATEFCQSPNVVKDLCGSQTFTATEFCQGTTVKPLCGTQTYTASQFCYNNSKVGDFCGARTATYNPDTYQCKPSVNANGIYLKAKPSDGINSYEAVLIGTQTWMAENLNHAAEGSVCYNNTATSCDTYGRLYNWTTAMAGAASSTANPSGVQGVCPSGWHLPSDAEWNALIAFVHSDNGLAVYTSGTSDLAGKYLKAESGWNSYSGIVNDDKYGFSALPGGYRYSDGSFYYVGLNGYWWTASEYYSSSAYNRYMYYNYESAYWSNDGKGSLRSVRCLKD
jgi:uncharacterized protein (TIGR02145 family)